MRWVIRHKKDKVYISSKFLLVCKSEFARKFNSRKQALAYLRESEYNKKSFEVIEYYIDLPDNMKLYDRESVECQILRKYYTYK